MAAQSLDRGESLADRIEDLYHRFGYGYEDAVSFTLEGKEGVEKIAAAIASMKADLASVKSPADAANLLGNLPIQAVRDYSRDIRYTFDKDGIVEAPTGLPSSDVLLYELGGEKGLDWACVRPSGTEPKLKIYFGIYGSDKQATLDRLDSVKKLVSDIVKSRL